MKRVTNIVFESLYNLNKTFKNVALNSPKLATKLYGAGGVLDSLALVSLVADLEDRILSAYGINVILADESAMSLNASPFRDVSSLIEHISRLIKISE